MVERGDPRARVGGRAGTGGGAPFSTNGIARAWPGDTIACVATGLSLTAADVERLRGKVRVIAVNDAHRLAPWADVLYSSDAYWWLHYQGVPAFAGRKVGIASQRADDFQPSWGITVLANTGDDGIEFRPTGLRTAWNSGGAAINLAVHLVGWPARILLLGYDMGATGASHFFGAHPPKIQNDSPYPTFIAKIGTMVEPLARAQIAVLNCTSRTALDCFPCVSLDEALSAREVAA